MYGCIGYCVLSPEHMKDSQMSFLAASGSIVVPKVYVMIAADKILKPSFHTQRQHVVLHLRAVVPPHPLVHHARKFS